MNSNIYVIIFLLIIIIFSNYLYYQVVYKEHLTSPIPTVSTELFNQHPMTIIPKNDILNFSEIVNNNSVRKSAYNDILSFVNNDMTKIYNHSRTCILLNGFATPVDYARNPGLEEKAIAAAKALAEQTKHCTSRGNTKNMAIEYQKDYQYVLVYLVSKDTKYADKIISRLITWSNECKTIIGGNAPLECSWAIVGFLRLQEILMYTYPDGWKKSGIETQWNKFIDEVVFPHVLSMYKNNIVGGRGGDNWKTSSVLARLMYSKVRKDKTQFNICIKNAYLVFDRLFGKYKTGQTSETARDIGHAQMGIGCLSQICEILYHHGIDLYSRNNNLLMKSYEFHAQIILGKITQIQDATGPGEGGINYPKFKTAGDWDMVYNHYTNVKKKKMPFTEEVLSKNRPDNELMMEHGLTTITHYNGPSIKPTTSESYPYIICPGSC